MRGASQVDARRKVHRQRLFNSARLLAGEITLMEDACGDDQVINAAKALRGCGECRFSSACGGDVGIAAPPHRVHARANSCELRGDRRANPRRPANYSDPSTAPVLLVPFGTCCLLWRDGLQLNQAIGEHVVNPRRDLDVLLGAINM